MSTSGKPDPAIGEFQRIAGAFVHDFNNLFQTALGNLDLLARRTDTPAAAELVKETIVSVERAVALTQRLNLIGNKYPQRFQWLEVDRTIAAAGRDMRERREIAFRGDAAGVGCRLPPGQLELALSALIFTGPAALSRGPLSIETSVCEIAAGSAEPAPGIYVRITVSASRDASPPPAHPARDSGVGFPLVRLFAAQLGGICRMAAESGCDGGARVELFLPAAAPDHDV